MSKKRPRVSDVLIVLLTLLVTFKSMLVFTESLAIQPQRLSLIDQQQQLSKHQQLKEPGADKSQSQVAVVNDVVDEDKKSSPVRLDLTDIDGQEQQQIRYVESLSPDDGITIDSISNNNNQNSSTEVESGEEVTPGEPRSLSPLQLDSSSNDKVEEEEVVEADEESVSSHTTTPLSKQPYRCTWRPTPTPAPRSATISDQATETDIGEPSIGMGRNHSHNVPPASSTTIVSPSDDDDSATAEPTPEVSTQESTTDDGANTLGSNECILGSSDVYLAWWINNDGSLRKTDPEYEFDGVGGKEAGVSNFIDMSGLGRNEVSLFYKLLQRLNEKRSTTTDIPIKFLSLARNSLDRAPYSSLNLIGKTLEYLSLAGNNFAMLNETTLKEDIPEWATFPTLDLLKELDLRSCQIAYINKDAFAEMQSLQKMYLAGNHIVSLSAQIFANVRKLVHLDLSHNSIVYTLTNFNENPFEWYTRGLEIDEYAFSELQHLKFLDFSHTRLEPSSMKSFAYLPSNLEQLSLCYTAITVIGLSMFHNLPNLKVLDLSGNSALTVNMNQNTFDGLQNSLEILAFENSSVKHLDWLGNLNSLKMLKLNDNNINQLTRDTFQKLPSLDILDLSFNHVGNWFTRVFETNTELKILNLRSNNLNMITYEMMTDFEPLQYLGLADNNFICNCLLRDLIDQALQNANPPDGHGYQKEIPNINDLLITQVLTNYLNNIGLEQTQRQTQSDTIIQERNDSVYDLYKRVIRSYVIQGVKSYQRIRTSKHIAIPATEDALSKLWSRNKLRSQQKSSKKNARYIASSDAKKMAKERVQQTRTKRSVDNDTSSPELIDEGAFSVYSDAEGLDFDFQLLDFEEHYYTCYNATSNEEYFFTELESCLLERVAGWQNLVQQLRPHQQRVSVVLYIVFVLMVIICIAYYKWWYIRYFFILIKNATILSFLNKESNDNGSRKSFGEISRDDVYLYDVFVSYCDENRDWVISELLPNIEQREEISICLHERDFLVGLSILENIIACMDRSKCLLLVVSQSFLLSQWCQFEMHLAQHRLLETCRERLVLILLEDIPKRKRPKTLGYLMKTKTYIKWPTSASEKSRSLAEERKIFWKRLRRSLIETDWECDGNNN